MATASSRFCCVKLSWTTLSWAHRVSGKVKKVNVSVRVRIAGNLTSKHHTASCVDLTNYNKTINVSGMTQSLLGHDNSKGVTESSA